MKINIKQKCKILSLNLYGGRLGHMFLFLFKSTFIETLLF